MATGLPKNCYLCNKTLRYGKGNRQAEEQGLPTGANTHDHDAKSEAHYGHIGGRNSRHEFEALSEQAWKAMNVGDKYGSEILCYECHEVVLHNPLLSESQLARLASFFRNKTFEGRVVTLNRIIEHGLTCLEKRLAAQNL